MAQVQEVILFNPTSQSGCQLWLDAADPNGNGSVPAENTSISTWVDKSGNGRNMTTTTAGTGSVTYSMYGGIESILFNSTSTDTAYMRVVSAVNLTNLTVFAVSRCQTARSNQNALLGVPASGFEYNSTDGFGMFIDSDAVNQRDRFYGSTSANIVTNSNPSSTDAYPLRMMCWINTSAGVLSSWFNGNTGTTNSSGAARTGTATGFGIGFDINMPAGSPLNITCVSQFSEFIVYNTVLSTLERQQIEGYLAWKWGLQGNLPANHPFKNCSPLAQQPFPLVGLPSMPIVNQYVPVFSPTQISGCQLWFDAADTNTFTLVGTNISQWRDKSSNAYSVSQATALLRPSLTSSAQNGLSGIQFATNTYLFTAGSNMANFTTGAATSVFIVGRNASTNTGWNVVNTIWFTGAVGGTTRYHFSFNQATTPGTTLFANGALVGQVTSNATPVNSNAILGFTASASSATIHTNGSLNSYSGVTLPSANNATYFLFGDARNDSGVSANIMMFEMIGYNTQVTTTQRQQIEGYLAWKWGIVSSLPTNHPYRIQPIAPFPFTIIPFQGRLTQWQPTQVAGCQLWLDASDRTLFTTSGNVVTAVTDKNSPPKTLSVTNTVTYSVATAVNFLDINGKFSVATMPSSPYDFFLVCTANASTANWRTMVRTTSSSHPFLLQAGADNVGMYDGGAFRQFGSMTMVPNEKALFYCTMALNRTMQASKNGTISLTASTPAAADSIIAYIGNSVTGTQPFGQLQEILVYSGTLTTQQRQQVEGYLAWKWNLQGNLPANHPFKLFPPSP